MLQRLIEVFDLDETKKEIIMGDMTDLINEDFWGRDYDVTAEYHKNLNESKEHYKLKPIMKTSKIKEVVSTKEYTNSYGTTIYHNLLMENGDKINIGKKKLQVVGWEITYEVIEEGQQEYNKAKAVKPEDAPTRSAQPSNTGYQKPKSNNASFALSYAKDIFIAHGVSDGSYKDISEGVTAIADELLTWLDSK